MSKNMGAEAIGTFILVFFGCGTAVLMGEQIGMLGISFAFGLSIVAAAHSLGPISGAHLNPAIRFGMVVAGRMTMAETGRYMVAQVAIIAALVIWLIALGTAT